MNNKNIIKNYDLDKLSISGTELFDIANKYQFYGNRAKTLYLKILYKLAYHLALFIAKKENRKALIK